MPDVTLIFVDVTMSGVWWERAALISYSPIMQWPCSLLMPRTCLGTHSLHHYSSDFSLFNTFSPCISFHRPVSGNTIYSHHFFIMLKYNFVAIFGLLALAASASAERRIVFPLQDATIFSSNPSSASSAGDLDRRTLIEFDLSTIPFDAKITDVLIQLSPNDQNDESSSLVMYRVTSPWTESHSINDKNLNMASEQDVTWSHATFPGVKWNKAGGDFSSNVLSTSEGQRVGDFGMTTQLQSTLQKIVTGDFPNFGFIILQNQVDSKQGSEVVSFASMEGANKNDMPRMIVDFDSKIGSLRPSATGNLQQQCPPGTRPIQSSGGGEGKLLKK